MENITLDQFRLDIAVKMMQSLLAATGLDSDYQLIAKEALKAADALIEALNS